MMSHYGLNLKEVLWGMTFQQFYHMFSVAVEFQSGDVSGVSDTDAESVRQEMKDTFVYDETKKRYVIDG